MDRGRILIIGNSKESTYEIRNMLDNRRFELEIALSPDVGRSILSERWMSLVIIHTDLVDECRMKILEFMADRALTVPVMVVGDEAKKYRQTITPRSEVEFFEKPYAVDEMLNYIRAL